MHGSQSHPHGAFVRACIGKYDDQIYIIIYKVLMISHQDVFFFFFFSHSCFNAFSRVDVRVEVKIPGGVESYVIDLRGERWEINGCFINPDTQ